MDIGIMNKLNKTSKSNSQLRFDKEDWCKNLKKSKLTPLKLCKYRSWYGLSYTF